MSIEGQGHFFTIYFPDFVCFVLYLAKISGERLQDHWSSGFNCDRNALTPGFGLFFYIRAENLIPYQAWLILLSKNLFHMFWGQFQYSLGENTLLKLMLLLQRSRQPIWALMLPKNHRAHLK